MAEILDAEFEMVPSGAAQPIEDVRRSKVTTEQMDVFLAHADGSHRPRRAASHVLFSAFLAVSCAAIFLLTGGHSLFRTHAGTDPMAVGSVSSTANGNTDLRLVDVSFREQSRGGRPFLVVEGTVVNTGSHETTIPAIRLRTGSGAQATQFLISRGERLDARQQLVFTSHVPLRDRGAGEPQLGFVK